MTLDAKGLVELKKRILSGDFTYPDAQALVAALEEALGLLRTASASFAHPASCICVICEDRRNFLARFKEPSDAD